MNFEDITRSKGFKKALIVLGVLIAVLIVFQAGVYVGVRKGEFSERNGENYYRVMGAAPGPGPFGDVISGGEGAAGKVLSVTLPTFVVEDRDSTEKIVTLGDGSDIRIFHDATSSGAITPGQFVIVIGEPDENGEIHASFVRIVPSPVPQ